MSQRVWLGGIYLKDEGGYELILRSLNHYKKRLKTIGRSPELQGAPMFAQLIQSEAMKTGPLIDQLISKIKEGLQDTESLKRLENEIPVFEKALGCYHSDIQKSRTETAKFYSELVVDKTLAASDLAKIQNALEKIKQFA